MKLALAAAAVFAASSAFALTPPRSMPVKAASRRWKAAGSFEQARFGGVLVKLRDGKALLAGGMLEGSAVGLAAVDLFDPATGDWTAGPPLREGRNQAAAVRLADGRVLVSGGSGPRGAIIGSTEIYDPARRAWTAAAAMTHIRKGHELALLPDGRVLAAGGWDGVNALSVAEIYDPAYDAWSAAAPMSAPRVNPAMTALRDGRLLISGGNTDSSSNASAEVYDPAKKAWFAAGAMSSGRYLHRLTVLPGGKAVASGGGGAAGATDTADVYDPATNSWTPTGPLGIKRYIHATALIGGKLMIIAGENASTALSSTEIYDAALNSWRRGPGLSGIRAWPHAVVLDDGRVLVAGGRRGLGGGMNLNTAEMLDAIGSLDPGPRDEPRSAVAMPAVERPAAHPPFDPENPDILPPAVAPRPNTHAVVIGVERYRETLPRADFAASDARLTAEYFRRVLGVPAENLALLSDDRATKSDFEKYFERWLPNRVEAGDEVYVYFSGHGAPNPKTGESYLVPFDADPTYIEQTGYPIKKIYEQLAKLPAKRVLLVMDSCFSGAGGRSVIAQGVRPLVTVVQSGVPRPLIVITASSGDQISNSYQEKRHGLFTYFFLKGLKEKGADFRAVYDYLKPQVSRIARRQYNSDQDPQWRKGK